MPLRIRQQCNDLLMQVLEPEQSSKLMAINIKEGGAAGSAIGTGEDTSQINSGDEAPATATVNKEVVD